jgi:hypothetical protein
MPMPGRKPFAGRIATARRTGTPHRDATGRCAFQPPGGVAWLRIASISTSMLLPWLFRKAA